MANDDLFPLRLVAFEDYMVVDDQADYPMLIRVDFELVGELSSERIELALKKALDENHLLRARIDEKAGQLYWVEGNRVEIQWTDEFPDSIRLSLGKAPGLKMFAQQAEGLTRFRIFFHHAVTDGAGICYFIERWFINYRSPSEPESDRSNRAGHDTSDSTYLDELQGTQALRLRGWFGMNFFKYLLRPFQEFCGAIGVLNCFTRKPVAIGPQQVVLEDRPSAEKPLSHRFVSSCFSKEESEKILSQSKRLGFKVNDLMLTAMFESMHHWLVQNQSEHADRCMRIMIPIDMRSKGRPEKLAANKVSMAFMDRRPGRYRSLKHLCWWVWIEMVAIKSMKLGLTFFHVIRFLRFRKKLHKLLRRDRSIATTVLSNMGPILNRSPLTDDDQGLRVDNVPLNNLRIYPPIRPYTWLTALITSYRGQLGVHSTYCGNSISLTDAEQILERFKINLLEGFEQSE